MVDQLVQNQVKLEQQLKQLKSNQDFRAERVSFLKQDYVLGIPEVEEFGDSNDRTPKTRFVA